MQKELVEAQTLFEQDRLEHAVNIDIFESEKADSESEFDNDVMDNIFDKKYSFM